MGLYFIKPCLLKQMEEEMTAKVGGSASEACSKMLSMILNDASSRQRSRVVPELDPSYREELVTLFSIDDGLSRLTAEAFVDDVLASVTADYQNALEHQQAAGKYPAQ